MDIERSGGFPMWEADPPDPGDGGGDPPPPTPEEPGGEGPRGGGPAPRVPRRGYRQYLPWIALGASVIATERISMVLLATSLVSSEVQLAAAAVLLTVVLGGVGLGGTAFYRAWHASQARRGHIDEVI